MRCHSGSAAERRGQHRFSSSCTLSPRTQLCLHPCHGLLVLRLVSCLYKGHISPDIACTFEKQGMTGRGIHSCVSCPKTQTLQESVDFCFQLTMPLTTGGINFTTVARGLLRRQRGDTDLGGLIMSLPQKLKVT